MIAQRALKGYFDCGGFHLQNGILALIFTEICDIAGKNSSITKIIFAKSNIYCVSNEYLLLCIKELVAIIILNIRMEKKQMNISYNGLWKILIDYEMKKTDLISEVGISSSTLAKMSKGEVVSMEILIKICAYFDCDFGDIVSYSKKGE